MGKCCPFFWVIRLALLVLNPSRSSPCFRACSETSLDLIEFVSIRFPVDGFCLLHFLAQGHGAWSLTVIRKSVVSVLLGNGFCSGCFVVGRLSRLVPPLLLCLLLLSFSFFSLLRGLRPGTGACILLSPSLLSLDDLTMPPYSPLPPPPMTPLLGNVNTFFAESKCWALARSSFLTLLCLLLFFCLALKRYRSG